MGRRRPGILALLVAVVMGGGVAVAANRSVTDVPADVADAAAPPPTEAAITASTVATTTTSTVATTTSTVVRTTSTRPTTSTTRRAVSTTIPPRPGARPTTTVTVPRPSTGQGPSLPKVTLVRGGPVAGHENDYLYVTLMGWADDADGFVRTLLLDWGDGSPVQTLPGDSRGCLPGATGWPSPSSAIISRTPPVWHQYFEKLTYFTVTLTAVSTGCDGSQEQRGTASLEVFIPA